MYVLYSRRNASNVYGGTTAGNIGFHSIPAFSCPFEHFLRMDVQVAYQHSASYIEMGAITIATVLFI